MIFVCLHFVVERGPISAMFYFENSLYLEVVTVVQGRGFLSKNDDAAATRQRYAAIVMRLVLVSSKTAVGPRFDDIDHGRLSSKS